MSLKQTFTIICILLLAGSMSAQIPNAINYQGRLTDSSGSPVADGAYLVKFIIYDASTEGTELWNSTFQLVNTIDGLFTYKLGSITPFPSDIFYDSSRYLGVTIGTDPELTPRTELNSVPYSIAIDDAKYVDAASDTMTGNLWMKNNSDVMTVNISPNDGGIWTYGLTDGLVRAALSSNPWGSLMMFDNFGNNTVRLDANNKDGGVLILFDPLGGEDIYLTAAGIGNSTVILPNDAISNTEILDEPGIASNSFVGYITLTSTMQDVVTVSITTPSAGYIYVTGRCWTNSSGKINYNAIATQIDEVAGGNYDVNHHTYSGAQSATTTNGSELHNVFIDRPYYKSSGGTFTFRLESLLNASGGIGYAGDARITAIYYPTSYGSVTTSSLQPPDNINSELINTLNPDGTSSQGYKYDLRDLELKAKKAALKLKEAEIELLKAQQYQNGNQE